MRPSDSIAGRAAAPACILLAGCLGATTSEPADVDQTARELWNTRAWPALAGSCGGCHGSQPAIDWLAPGTVEGAYETVFAFQPPVLDVEAPAASLLLTMGKHTGPAIAGDNAAAVLAWLEAERSERLPDSGSTMRVGPVIPTLGAPMTFDLVNGATLVMTATSSQAGFYVSTLTVSSGAGLHLAHPLFVQRPPHPILDELDRFSDLDVTLAPNTKLELGPAWFLSFDPNEYTSIHFATLEAPQ